MALQFVGLYGRAEINLTSALPSFSGHGWGPAQVDKDPPRHRNLLFVLLTWAVSYWRWSCSSGLSYCGIHCRTGA